MEPSYRKKRYKKSGIEVEICLSMRVPKSWQRRPLNTGVKGAGGPLVAIEFCAPI